MKGNQYTLIIPRSMSTNNYIYIQQQWCVCLPKLFTKNTRKKNSFIITYKHCVAKISLKYVSTTVIMVFNATSKKNLKISKG